MTEAPDRPTVDVAIVGAGLVGATLAGALAARGRSVMLVERADPPSGEGSWDERCIGLNLASRDILRAHGLWEPIEAAGEPIRATHISERGRFGVARFSGADAGTDCLGVNAPMRVIAQAALDAARGHDNVEWLCPARVVGADAGTSQEPASLSLVCGGGGEQVLRRARLIVAADGAQSAVRSLLGIEADTVDYGQKAIVTAARFERGHRGVAYERFTPDGPIAVLPKPDDACGVIWTQPSEQADARMSWDDDRFAAAVQDAFGFRLGRLTTLGRRNVYPLMRVMSRELVAGRVVLAGNAAQTLHPVVAQGFNLGLRDVATLVECIGDHGDPAEPGRLATYAGHRAADRREVADFTDRLVRLFSNRLPGLAALRHVGLLALDFKSPLREQVMQQNLGYGHVLPVATGERERA